MKNRRTKSARLAFTLMELLVVIGIIAMLVGLLAPGMRAFSKHAKGLKQKAILHSMEVGLEFFRDEFDDYPESSVISRGGNNVICGAQHLVEALVGRDGRGFEPSSKWYAPEQDPDLYLDNNTAQGQKSLYRRKGPYVELKDTGAYLIDSQLYDSPTTNLYSNPDPANPLLGPRAPVFADIFRHRKVTLPDNSTELVGNPIVYFKANAASRFFGNDTIEPNRTKWTYNYRDNMDIFDLGPVKDPANMEHRYDRNYTDPDSGEVGDDIFYADITNPKANTPNFKKPFNAKSFILMSAGYDGIFGTKDDITNFNY